MSTLVVGDGMDLKIDNHLSSVAGIAVGSGKLEGSGDVSLLGPGSGSKTLTAEWHVVFFRTTATAVTADTTARMLVE